MRRGPRGRWWWLCALVGSGLVLGAVPLLIDRHPALAGTTFIVTTADDSGLGSLRQAIDDANLPPGTDAISFAIGGSPPPPIVLLSALPAVTDPVVIDGTTQPGFVDRP